MIMTISWFGVVCFCIWICYIVKRRFPSFKHVIKECYKERRTLFFLYGSLFRRSSIAWGKSLSRLLPQYDTFCIWVLLLSFLVFLCILNFFKSKCYFPNKSYYNYGLNFIKHVDCGREVSKETHKVLIEKQFKIVDFYCWLRKWELYYLANMERQMVTFAF